MKIKTNGITGLISGKEYEAVRLEIKVEQKDVEKYIIHDGLNVVEITGTDLLKVTEVAGT